jgi:hypothetical protein
MFLEILVEGGTEVPTVREILQRHFSLVENTHFRIHPHKVNYLKNHLLTPIPNDVDYWINYPLNYAVIAICRKTIVSLC